ncbi:MAG: M20/M25/M40 family metallo-hydrolase [Thaumarchaeota archaeon]|nr:M20/M25/M40 family metallo-hydrolase [Nitrososphaerota archaeon]MDE1830792.1 M20/M25/M40 family metallo-hydrolase [Nitrososphaerota archaeon]MDE1840743.1 M20/M25/M40 family metallo-hydrolase [Nitrososphaerota archaeon]MDE1877780.1 M20/M25/M40 family metallo-hydrolase [Nitrososphaerota archaeon]
MQENYVDKNFSSLISDLQKLIRQPSVSAKNLGLEECSRLIVQMMRKSGIRAEVLYIKKGVPPAIYGEVTSRQNPDKTLLFYNHYDVQPEEPVELWDDKPFSGKIKGNKIFGRGSADDKGELITRIKAVESFLKTTGDVPCNIKFFIEGEEEIGSVHIEDYLKKYKEKLSCDAVIWEFGYVDEQDRPIISLGMKGLLYVELSKTESIRDAHSSLAVIIENPAWRLVGALKTLRDDDGRVLIKDWYKEVDKFTQEDIKIIASEPFDEHSFKKEYGITKFVGNKKGIAIKKALVGESTCNIAGFASGYDGPGAKTVLPSKALVKIDFRLVPKMDPKKQLLRLKNHLRQNGFGDIQVTLIHGEAAARTAISDPFVSAIKKAADASFGRSILSVSSAGTGPMFSFVKFLRSPCIAIGSTYIFSRIHSPNEFARIDLLKKTTKCMCKIIRNFAS